MTPPILEDEAGIVENAFVESICRLYHQSFKESSIRQNIRLPRGSVDIVVQTPENILTLIECKIGGSINDIAHALGQLLFYREQIDESAFKTVACTIYCHDRIDRETLSFAESVCAKYGVGISWVPKILRLMEENE